MIKKVVQNILKKLAQFVEQIFGRVQIVWNLVPWSKRIGGVASCLRTYSGRDEAHDLRDRIVRLLIEEKVYKSPKLDLKKLSERLEAPSYLVTKAINEGLGLNFYELINRYRVEEVKSLLADRSHKRFTLMSVAFDAGFSSKTTFNTVFKKMTGETPSSYRNQRSLQTERSAGTAWRRNVKGLNKALDTTLLNV